MDDRELIKAMLTDADKRAFERNIPVSTAFLSMDEQNIYFGLSQMFKSWLHFLDGGHEDPDRAAAFFLPDYADRGFETAEAIKGVRVTPLNERFAEELSHRDYLGALMNLGIERDTIGDILTGEKECYIFALSSIAEVIVNELSRVRHTSVACEIADRESVNIKPKFEELSVNVASERADAVIAAVYKISRQRAAQLIDADHVVISGRQSVNSAKNLKEGDRVSVRGFGKFIYGGVNGNSRRGRLYVDIHKFA